MEHIADNSDTMYETAADGLGDYQASDYYDVDGDAGDMESAARLFFLVFNTSSTLTTAQALTLVLGLTALFGGLALAAYWLLITLQEEEGGYGSGSGSGSGYGHSGHGSHGRDFDRRSVGDDLTHIVSILAKMEDELSRLGVDKDSRDECKQRQLCYAMDNYRNKMRKLTMEEKEATEYLSELLLDRGKSVLESQKLGGGVPENIHDSESLARLQKFVKAAQGQEEGKEGCEKNYGQHEC